MYVVITEDDVFGPYDEATARVVARHIARNTAWSAAVRHVELWDDAEQGTSDLV